MGIEDECLETASVGIMERGSSTGDLLPHVALDEAEEFMGEVQEVGNDDVNRDEAEGELRVQFRVVMRINA